MDNPQLKLFTEPAVLRYTSRDLLAKFFERFAHLLPKYGLPNPVCDEYPDRLAELLHRPMQFPVPLVQALVAVEQLAATQSPPPDHPVNGDPDAPRLTQAIELWLSSPAAAAIARESPPAPVISQTPPAPFIKASPVEPPLAEISEPDLDSFIPPGLSNDLISLARLSTVEYERIRLSEAHRLGLRVRTLDKQVARCRAQFSNDAKANAVKLPRLEPWPEPVQGDELLNEVLARFNLYLALCRGADVAFTLWTGHTHAFTAFHQTPRLNLHSTQSGCGKTTALEVLATMTPRPLSTENLKPAVLFRVVAQHQPTLLLDELDTYLCEANELRGLLNAGHKRGACAYRCEGDGNRIRAFNAFAPAALAGIGPLPATLRDRSILIPLVKAKPGEIRAQFDPRNTEIETILGRKLARWANDNFDALVAFNPPMPAGAFNRLADNWRPLFAIAHIAGGDWPQRAAEAFALLTPKPLEEQNLELMLLVDIQSIFAASAAQRLFSTSLVQSLNALPNRPWASMSEHKDRAWLGRLLRVFNVRSHNIRIGTTQAKGYDLADFVEPFALFLNNNFKKPDSR